MAFSYGFFNSVNHDRRYSALQFMEMFDGILSDGIFPNVGGKFQVKPGADTTVIVSSGKAMFDHVWCYNENDLPIMLDLPDLLLPRIDAVILDINTNVSERKVSIQKINGYPAVNPSRPTLIKSGAHYQYALAYIRLAANASSIATSDISNMVGTSETPYLSAQLSLISITNALQKWEKDFRDWLDSIKDATNENKVIELMNKLDALNPRITNIENQVGTLEDLLNQIKNNM